MLVSLADIKAYLGITSGEYDSFLTQQEAFISEVVESYCGRKFSQATYVQTFYDTDYSDIQKELKMFHYPLISMTSVTEDAITLDTTEYRVHKATGTVVKPEYFFTGTEITEFTYSAGYSTTPLIIKNVILALIQEKYNQKTSGVPLNFGSDVQSISIPGTISISYDYSLDSNQRKSAYGVIIGSYANSLDMFRSERRVIGSGKLKYVSP